MNPPKVYYDEAPIKITFEPAKQGYWISIMDSKKDYSNYFIDSRAFEEVLKTEGSIKRLSKLRTLDDLIIFSLGANNILPSTLSKALDEVKNTLDNEFEEFKKTL